MKFFSYLAVVVLSCSLSSLYAMELVIDDTDSGNDDSTEVARISLDRGELFSKAANALVARALVIRSQQREIRDTMERRAREFHTRLDEISDRQIEVEKQNRNASRQADEAIEQKTTELTQLDQRIAEANQKVEDSRTRASDAQRVIAFLRDEEIKNGESLASLKKKVNKAEKREQALRVRARTAAAEKERMNEESLAIERKKAREIEKEHRQAQMESISQLCFERCRAEERRIRIKCLEQDYLERFHRDYPAPEMERLGPLLFERFLIAHPEILSHLGESENGITKSANGGILEGVGRGIGAVGAALALHKLGFRP